MYLWTPTSLSPAVVKQSTPNIKAEAPTMAVDTSRTCQWSLGMVHRTNPTTVNATKCYISIRHHKQRQLVPPIYMIHLNPTGSIKPPFLKHSMNSANANPPHAPIKYLAAFQKKTAIAPPIIPAIVEASTNKPRSVVLGGLTAAKIQNFKMRTMQTRDSV